MKTFLFLLFFLFSTLLSGQEQRFSITRTDTLAIQQSLSEEEELKKQSHSKTVIF